jgi:hypothetical protein
MRTTCEDDPFDIGFVSEFIARDQKISVTMINVTSKLTASILEEARPLSAPHPCLIRDRLASLAISSEESLE